jgi:hypothetical protein
MATPALSTTLSTQTSLPMAEQPIVMITRFPGDQDDLAQVLIQKGYPVDRFDANEPAGEARMWYLIRELSSEGKTPVIVTGGVISKKSPVKLDTDAILADGFEVMTKAWRVNPDTLTIIYAAGPLTPLLHDEERMGMAPTIELRMPSINVHYIANDKLSPGVRVSPDQPYSIPRALQIVEEHFQGVGQRLLRQPGRGMESLGLKQDDRPAQQTGPSQNRSADDGLSAKK